MKTETETRAFRPWVAEFCWVIGGIMIVLGLIVIVFFELYSGQGGGPSLGIGFALLFSATLWFALARIIILLAQIEKNTRWK